MDSGDTTRARRGSRCVINGTEHCPLHSVGVKPWSLEWLIAAGAYPGFCSMKRLGVFLLPLDGMLIHRRSLPRSLLDFPQQFSGTHLYSWVERGTVRVKCLAQEHNSVPSQGSNLGSSALTMRPPRLHLFRVRRKISQLNQHLVGFLEIVYECALLLPTASLS